MSPCRSHPLIAVLLQAFGRHPCVQHDTSLKHIYSSVYSQVCRNLLNLPNLQALEGKYVEPGPGGDPIRNPAVLPTGKNIHALDPQSIPTQAALKSARVVVER